MKVFKSRCRELHSASASTVARKLVAIAARSAGVGRSGGTRHGTIAAAGGTRTGFAGGSEGGVDAQPISVRQHAVTIAVDSLDAHRLLEAGPAVGRIGAQAGP